MAPRPLATTPNEASAPDAGFHLPAALGGAAFRCWKKAAAPKEWNLSSEQFETGLARSVAQRFSSAASRADLKAIENYLESLHHADLALACACSAGNAAAWEFFVTQFRPELHRAGCAIAGDSNGRELADSLYADLYGLRESGGRRRSLFDYFHGRSKLATWLRAVLAQRHVDAIRSARKSEPLEDESGREHAEVAAFAAASQRANDPPEPDREKYLALLQAALAAALDSLEPRDRLRLACYYGDDRTLAEIGKMLGEHEATVSRKLERTRRDLRRRVEASLREKKLTDAQVRVCFDYAREEWPFDLTLRLPAPETPGSRAGGAAGVAPSGALSSRD